MMKMLNEEDARHLFHEARVVRLACIVNGEPYVVPINWKRVSFWEIGSNWPSQNIHPAGAKFPAKILISPTYGWAISFSSGH